MGYTHYWRTTKPVPIPAFEAWVKDCKLVAEDQRSTLAGWNGERGTSPEFTSELVRLNGVGDDAHETFAIDLSLRAFDFCKTARKPYDLAVTAMLCLADLHFGDCIDISSDGEPADWHSGLLLAQAINPDCKIPREVVAYD